MARFVHGRAPHRTSAHHRCEGIPPGKKLARNTIHSGWFRPAALRPRWLAVLRFREFPTRVWCVLASRWSRRRVMDLFSRTQSHVVSRKGMVMQREPGADQSKEVKMYSDFKSPYAY